MTQIRALIQDGPRSLRMSELPTPQVGDDDALLQVEACGICRTDLEQYDGYLSNYPFIPGHEIVGTIAEIGAAAADRWHVSVGDRVAVEPMLVCHRCRSCMRGAKWCDRYPANSYRSFGFISTSVAPGLWGGYAEYLYLHPDTNLHPVPPGLDPQLAVLFNPLANAIEWAVEGPQPQFGDTVVVLGAGQRGLASVIALRARGIRNIVVTGLTSDSHKLEIAQKLGAATVDVQQQNLREVVQDVSGSSMAAVVVDTTPRSTDPILDALDVVRPGGTVIVAGMKDKTLEGFDPNVLLRKDITIRAGVAASHHVYREAIDMVASEIDSVSLLRTHVFKLEEATRAFEMMAGIDRTELFVSIVLTP